jgi:hypothetical protein
LPAGKYSYQAEVKSGLIYPYKRVHVHSDKLAHLLLWGIKQFCDMPPDESLKQGRKRSW